MIPTNLLDIAATIGAEPGPDIKDETVRGVSTDSRTIRAGELFFALKGERFDGHDHIGAALEAGAAACVVSRRVEEDAERCLLVNDTLDALGRLGSAHRDRISAKVIAVTGSNGKTTTKNLIDHVLRSRLRGRSAAKSFNNHVGVPLTLLSAEQDDEYLVVEIGTNAPGEVAHLAALASPDIAVITSIGNAHLEGLGGPEGVIREKLSLLQHVRPGGSAVVNVDWAGVVEAINRWLPVNVGLTTFGRGDATDLRVVEVRSSLDGTRFRVNDELDAALPVCGAHNAVNATAALAVARNMGLDDADTVCALASFQPVDGRLNVSQHGTVTVIDDCYNANPSSVEASIDVLASADGRRRVLVVGDMLELGSYAAEMHRRVGERAARAGIEVVVAAGMHAGDVTQGATAATGRSRTIAYKDANRTAEAVHEWLPEDGVVLIKGSRAMRMERVVAAITEAAVARAAVAVR